MVQQTRAKKKDEFANAFGPILPEALEMAYKGASNDVQGKIRYVVDVWKQRGVFSKQVQDRIEAKLDGKRDPLSVLQD